MATRTQQLEQAGLIDAGVSEESKKKLEELLSDEDVRALLDVTSKVKDSGTTLMFGGAVTRSSPEA